jgi:hypothetical protein
MNTYFPEPPSVLTTMFYHFELDDDFAIRCIHHLNTQRGNHAPCGTGVFVINMDSSFCI